MQFIAQLLEIVQRVFYGPVVVTTMPVINGAPVALQRVLAKPVLLSSVNALETSLDSIKGAPLVLPLIISHVDMESV